MLALADGAGTVQTSYTYEPFGNTTASGSANTNSYQYTGRENDGTGLYYYRARYYNPVLQRFIGWDPIGLEGGLNTYAYVENNPLVLRDPRGLTGGGFPGMGDPLGGWIDQANNYYNEPAGDDRCIRCFVDFVNPFPDMATEKGAEEIGKKVGGRRGGKLMNSAIKRINRGRAFIDLGACLSSCRDNPDNLSCGGK